MGRGKKLKSKINKQSHFRIYILYGVFILANILIVCRLCYLQILKNDEFRQKMVKKTHSLELAPWRGSICDRNGYELAVSLMLSSAYVHPDTLKNKKKFLKNLTTCRKVNISSIKGSFNRNKPFVWIKRKITPKEKNQLIKLETEGLIFTEEAKRYYPHTSLASHVVGFTGMDGDGLEGIEFKFDSILRGEERRISLNCDFYDDGRISKYGSNLILTLDSVIQYFADEELFAACEKLKARAGMLMIMDIDTGEILAMSNWPSFNPNIFNNYPQDSWRNRCITDCFEPGSILKVFGLAAALEENMATPLDIIDCQYGSICVSGCTIRDHKKYGKLSVRQVLENSSNVGAIKIAQRLGNETYYRYLKKFGFGEKTDISLPAEGVGMLKAPKDWSGISLASLAIGQEISVTPIQFLSAFASLINGGYKIDPIIVKMIYDKDGKKIDLTKRNKNSKNQIVSENTSKIVRDILKGVVERGTGTLAAIDGYDIGGKTGTAQKLDPDSGSYSHDKYVVSFVGFFPGLKPKWAMLVIIDEPDKKRAWGGESAAPVFRVVAAKTMDYLHQKPDDDMQVVINEIR